jgi:hypothetical protein
MFVARFGAHQVRWKDPLIVLVMITTAKAIASWRGDGASHDRVVPDIQYPENPAKVSNQYDDPDNQTFL